MDVRRSINTRIWVDDWFDDLDAPEKLLFIYLLTNQNTNLLGIYEESVKRMAINTCLPKETVEQALERFSRDGKVYYSNGWIWVVNIFKNQAWNPKMLTSAKRHLEALEPNTKQSFMELDTVAFNRLLIAYDSLCISSDKKEKVNSKEEIIKMKEGKGNKKKEKNTDIGVFEKSFFPTVKNRFSNSHRDIILIEEWIRFTDQCRKNQTEFDGEDHALNAFQSWLNKLITKEIKEDEKYRDHNFHKAMGFNFQMDHERIFAHWEKFFPLLKKIDGIQDQYDINQAFMEFLTTKKLPRFDLAEKIFTVQIEEITAPLKLNQ